MKADDKISNECMKYIVSRLLEKAYEAHEESSSNRTNQFASGRSEAYYEMLDVLQTELEANGQDLKEYGLDIDLLNKIA